MTEEMIAHEELIAREDLTLSNELISRINSARATIRTLHALSAAEAAAVHDLLGDCSQALVDVLYQNRRNQMRMHIANMTLKLMSVAPARFATEIEMPLILAAAAAADNFVAA